ncbi:MAG: 16S rRNA (guanine(966)-N(2))-methyltransferase RsmD [Thiobacillus sp.]|nr:16S rRNA (guanine(966)-N(2))-methyltransferase RsmD [Thiobacillus sp.]
MRPGRSNQVRIIAGRFRRRLLHFPDVPGLRPTPDRTRETLFNWLGQDLTGLSCLDAFAGSGALGFEAASRGAGRVVLWERDAKALAALRGNALELGIPGVEVMAADALSSLRATGESFDVIFLDPPFSEGLLEPALAAAATRLRPGGRIYAESPMPLPAELLQGFGLTAVRQGKAGLSHYCLLERM